MRAARCGLDDAGDTSRTGGAGGPRSRAGAGRRRRPSRRDVRSRVSSSAHGQRRGQELEDIVGRERRRPTWSHQLLGRLGATRARSRSRARGKCRRAARESRGSSTTSSPRTPIAPAPSRSTSPIASRGTSRPLRDVNSIEDFDEADFRAQIETNLWGVINLTRAALPTLREQGAGHIIQISSVGGRDTAPGIGPYQTAKWAVEGFSGVLAKEVAPLGIKVTIIEPGGFRTDWAGSSMTVHAIRDAYQPTVGTMASYREAGHAARRSGQGRRRDPGDRPGPRAAAAAAARQRRVRRRARRRRGQDRLRRGLEGPDRVHRSRRGRDRP